MFNKFINYGYNSFIKEWQEYYKNNFLTFFDELNDLKQNLDEISKNSIDSFIQTVLFKLATPVNNYLIKKDYLYSKLEQKKIKNEALKDNEINDIKKIFKINDDFILQTAVFKYHNGIKFLPQNNIKNLVNTIFLDCGAYYGDSSLIFTKYKPEQIYAFEPNSINYKYLKQTIKNNHLNNIIIPINKGISEINSYTTLSFNSIKRPNLGAKITKKNLSNKYKEKINLITIDSFVEQYNLKKIGLIKIDIEGYELEALIGAKQTIKKYKPILLIAIYHNAEEFLKSKPFLESLNINYKYKMLSLDTKDILKEFYLIAY